MKKSIYLSFVSLLLSGTMLTGCSDYLDGSEQNRSNINVNNITAEQFSTYAFKQMQTIFDGSTVQEMIIV